MSSEVGGLTLRQVSGDSSSPTTPAASAPVGQMAGRAVVPLNNGEGARRPRQCRCNLLQLLVIATVGYFLYRNFSGGTAVVNNGAPQNEGGFLPVRGNLRQQPAMAERGGLRERVLDQQQQAAPAQPLPQRGELRNGVRIPQPGINERGNLRDAHR